MYSFAQFCCCLFRFVSCFLSSMMQLNRLLDCFQLTKSERAWGVSERIADLGGSSSWLMRKKREGGIENLLFANNNKHNSRHKCVSWFFDNLFSCLLLVVALWALFFVIGVGVLLLHCVALCCVRCFAFLRVACLFAFVCLRLFVSLFCLWLYVVCCCWLMGTLPISKLSVYHPFTTTKKKSGHPHTWISFLVVLFGQLLSFLLSSSVVCCTKNQNKTNKKLNAPSSHHVPLCKYHV